MPVVLYRIDDRLVHGQVVVGWGNPLNIGFIVLMDDEIATCDWEQDLYKLGVPPHMEIFFATASEVADSYQKYAQDQRAGIVLAGTPQTMLKLVELVPDIEAVNIGGLHHRSDRVEKLRYVFLNPEEESALAEIESHGVRVTAQDVPSARPVPLDDLISEGGSARGPDRTSERISERDSERDKGVLND